MSELAKNPFDAMLDAFRQIVREEIAARAANGSPELLEPEELAGRLKVPVSWVYEQSRQGKRSRLGTSCKTNPISRPERPRSGVL